MALNSLNQVRKWLVTPLRWRFRGVARHPGSVHLERGDLETFDILRALFG
jgi:hypothetical protein